MAEKEKGKRTALHTIRRSFVYQARVDRVFAKTLAFAIDAKTTILPHSCMPYFSVNKLHKIMGCSVDTIKKYLPLCIKYGFATLREEEDGSKTLIFHRLASSTAHRNVSIIDFCFDSFKDIYNSLRALFVTIVSAKKKFAKKLVQKATNPKNWLKRGVKDNVKKAKRACNQFGWSSFNGGLKYVENGFSYSGIAKLCGCCVRTAQRIVKYGIRHRFFTKKRRKSWTYMPGVNYMPVPGFTFTTKDFGCVQLANIYELTPQWRDALVDVSAYEVPLTEDEYEEIMDKREQQKHDWIKINKWRWDNSRSGLYVVDALKGMGCSDEEIEEIKHRRCPTNKEVFCEGWMGC